MPFFYATKTNGFFYQQEDNAEDSDFVDWPDEMSFPGNGVVRMEPDGPTDFGVGKNIKGFKDSIGGCDMDFEATQARGYAYKADDPRDVEYKAIIRFDDIDPDEGFSISFDTGHHTDDGCCQGFAYMVNLRPGADPCEFRFRKEMYHVHYISKPFFTDDRVDFRLNGHGWIGFAGVRYNKPGAINTTVIIEMWFNNDPINHPLDWFKLATLEDKPGSGFGDGGDQCNGDDDQVGTWSNVQSRMKTNSSSGFAEFKAITLREIDPTKSFDDTPPPPSTECPSGQVWNGTECVPQDGGGSPPPGGGTGQPSQISPVISYIILASKAGGYPTVKPPMTGVQAMTLSLAEDLAETMTDPNNDAIDGPSAWRTTATSVGEEGEIGGPPCDHDFSNAASLPLVHTFADGLMVEPYWSNKDNACELSLSGNPGGGEPPPSGIVRGVVSQVVMSDVTEFVSSSGVPTQSAYTVMVIGEEIIECMTDTEDDGWHADLGDVDGQIGERCDGPGQGGDFLDNYSDGVYMEGYWSNSNNGCVIPGLEEPNGERNPDTKSGNLVYHGGRVMQHPIINIIFWGNDWTGQSSPSMNSIYTLVRDHLLNPASDSGSKYWTKLSQYSNCGIPTYGEHIQYTDSDPPATVDSDADSDKYYNMLADSIQNIFSTAHGLGDLENQIYITLLPHGSVFSTGPNSFSDGRHFFNEFEFNVNSNEVTANAVAQANSTVDSNGIGWLEATGEILSWGMSRDDADDFRWSKGTDGMKDIGKGYEVTWFVNCDNVDNSGHTALKCGGPNHSGDCGGEEDLKEDGECCCWYDIGIRENGDIQTQIERPHPDNTDMDCDDCTMSNIGMGMNDGWIGLKLILHPENEGGDVEHGGIRIKFYISTDAIVDGIPTNDWELVFNTLDTGQWLPDYKWPMAQELEMRLSGVDDTNDVKLYKDKVFARKWIRDAGTPIPPGQTGRIVWHGGRIMKTPIVNLIFWGSDWDTRNSDPTRANVITYVRDKLIGTDNAYFNNLNQYGGIGKPIYGQAVTNLTYPIPTGTRVSEEDARLVINNTIETALLPQGVDFNNTIYVVILPVNMIGYHPQNNVQFVSTHSSYKPTLTVTDTGAPDQPTDIIVIQGAFALKSDINVFTSTACSLGTSDPGGGGSGGVSKFYEVTDTSQNNGATRELCDDSTFSNRTRIAQRMDAGSPNLGRTLKQADVYLRDIGSPAASPVVSFKIWNSGNSVVYTSPTTFAGNTFTGSFATKTFDCSTNTRAFVAGDRCGVEYTGSDDANCLEGVYTTDASQGTNNTSMMNYEAGAWETHVDRNMCMVLWE